MKVLTTRFGEVTIPDNSVVTFPEGLQGLPALKSFVFLRTTDLGLLRWLQSVDSPALACVVCNPRLILPEYVARVPLPSVAGIGITDASDADLLIILRHHEDRSLMTADLQRPIIYNPARRLARHVLLPSADYSRYHRIFPDITAPVSKSSRPDVASSYSDHPLELLRLTCLITGQGGTPKIAVCVPSVVSGMLFLLHVVSGERLTGVVTL